MTGTVIGPGSEPAQGTGPAGAGVRDHAVREQLQRILSSPMFRNSKRYAAVLKYVIEQTLAGNEDRLKERTIGVDVFGREHDYDTASDHVVRSAVTEVRKRLAQYYQESCHADELRFEVQPGSYVPQFRWTRSIAAPGPTPSPEENRSPQLYPGYWRWLRNHRFSRRTWLITATALCGLMAAATLEFRNSATGREALATFWAPVLASKEPVLICMGNLQGGITAGVDASPLDLRAFSVSDFHRLPSETVHVSDAIAMARLTGLVESRGKPWWIATQSEISFGDLRKGPAILIGLMNNDWTERLVGKLRFHAEKLAPHRVVIRDIHDPARSDWSMDYSTPLLKITHDYALVLRVVDPNTGQTVITAAGISVFGTQAAAEFLTDSDQLRALDRFAPGWEKKNLEIVLSTEVVRAKSGLPHIVAARIW